MARRQFLAAFVTAGLMAAVTIAAANAQSAGPAAAATAQNAPAQAGPAGIVHAYDAAKEIVVKGTVEKVVDAQAPDNLSGTHAFVTTAQGTIDAHLGSSALWKAQNLTLARGDAVELIGAMTNFNGNSVLLARTLKTGKRIAVLRNEHGIPARVSGPRSVNAAPPATGGRP